MIRMFPEESGDNVERLRFLRKLNDLSLPNLYDNGGENISEFFLTEVLRCDWSGRAARVDPLRLRQGAEMHPDESDA